ncbi:S8 family serine peptidase [Actinocrispum wychmicini]|uniref:S8 family serine peptidase n=1 Tax=Actinocrispum wychmicini TaxID=1213861 RepID=UPI001405540D|nr:S8 family serine peptidase [Actinocrispum wychmicini]
MAVGSVAVGVAFGATQVVADAAPQGGSLGTGDRSVTLITGDRVVMVDSTRDARSIIPGKGRDKVAFSTYQRNGHRYVVPKDAVSLVAQGKLDERLFDVTTLVQSGYDDRSRSTLPLIVSYAPGVARAQVAGVKQTANLTAINSAAVAADKTGAVWQSVRNGSVRKVWLDGKVQASLDRSVPQIGGPEAWKAGYTGKGVKVAILDTGVDETHPDLAGRQLAEQNFSDAADNVDRFGHGTHVASTIAGNGAKSGGKYKGVAYDAQILDGKVLDDNGGGLESWIIAGMQWAVDQGAKVVNLSVGGPDSPGVDPLEQAVNDLSKTGTLFVIAAGNSGADESIQSPGSADAALTVGAVDRNDALAPFSSRGPRVGDSAIKPDITAPGVGIVAAKAAQGKIGTPAADGYVALSGTSMATPHVAGSAVLLAQQHPDWTGQQIKATLTASAKPNPALNSFAQGSGRVDVARAIGQTVTSDPTNVSIGTQIWPHDDDQPVTKSVTYHNSGTKDVALDVSVNGVGPDGKAAPAGMLTASPATVTVPAGGSASVNVTADTKVDGLDGVYSGNVTATSRDTQVLTPVAVNREPESYTLTINHIGLDGRPAVDYGTALINLETGQFTGAYSPDGRVTVRLPKGRYVLDSSLVGDRISWLSYPALNLTDDTTVDLDFRTAKQTQITPPDGAALRIGDISYTLTSGKFPTGFGWVFLGGDLGDLWTAGLGPQLPPGDLLAQYNTQWSGQNNDFFGLGYYANGIMPTGFVRTEKKETLGHVHTSYAAPVAGRSGLASAFPYPKFGPAVGGWAVLLPVGLPGERTEYYSPEAMWAPSLWQMGQGDFAIEATLTAPVRTFESGKNYEASFNRGVFAPALPQTKFDFDYLTRSGDTILADIPLFGDASGNAGTSATDKASTVLTKDGLVVGQTARPGFGSFDVPAGAGNYTLATEAVRSGVSDVSTTVRAAWTFKSANTGAGPVRLPLSTVRFTPALDPANSAPAGESLIIPITFAQQATGTGTVAKTLTVEASFDGGLTWSPTTVVANVLAVVQHPNDATTVSLRAKASDRAGNTVEESLINAYKLR